MKELIGKRSKLSVFVDKDVPTLYSPDGEFIPFCGMKDKPCYEHYRFKCPNYDEYVVVGKEK